MLALEFPPISHLFDWEEILFEGTPFAISKTIILLWAAVALVMWLFLAAGRSRSLVPTGVRNLVEVFVEFIERGIIREVMGPSGLSFLPLLVGMFFFILFLNIFGMIPGVQFPPTSRMAIPGMLAVLVWVLYNYQGVKHQGFFGYLKSSLFPPGVPKALYVLVVPIEFLSTFIVRPFSLAVRLFANMMAGHLLLVGFGVICAALWDRSLLLAILPVSLATTIALTGFKLLVSVLQAYIFTILTAVYIGGAQHPEH